MFLAKLKTLGIALFVAAGVVATSAVVRGYQGSDGPNAGSTAVGPPAKSNTRSDVGKAFVKGAPAAAPFVGMGLGNVTGSMAGNVAVTAQDVLNSEKATFDTLLGVYTGNAVGTLTAIANDDDGGPDYTSSLTTSG